MKIKVKELITKDSYKLWYQKANYTAHYTNGVGLVDYQDALKYCDVLPDIHMFMHDSGMCATHNMPCPVCKVKHAVFSTNGGYFDVCHTCREGGWYVGKREMINGKPKRFWEFWK